MLTQFMCELLKLQIDLESFVRRPCRTNILKVWGGGATGDIYRSEVWMNEYSDLMFLSAKWEYM